MKKGFLHATVFISGMRLAQKIITAYPQKDIKYQKFNGLWLFCIILRLRGSKFHKKLAIQTPQGLTSFIFYRKYK